MASCWNRYFGVRDDKEDDVEDENSSSWDNPCSNDRNTNNSGDIMVNISTSRYKGVFEDDPLFNEVLRDAEVAIESEILPTRIYQGSSGSYFVKNVHGVKIDVTQKRIFDGKSDKLFRINLNHKLSTQIYTDRQP
ncbi:unnamed protein product [Orchesella dallaii]|uniref:Phosphatidylinositol 4-kinase type 2 n=1 Tax=Orchesella dallaii TaxID=48710 RepID=A0ABP1RQI2_9HEXA